MLFTFSSCVVDIDVEKTKLFYKNAEYVSCECSGCRNFVKATNFLQEDVHSFFSSIGVDINKACELIPYYSKKDEVLFYGGFYHICGRVLHGVSRSQAKKENEIRWHRVSGEFLVSFNNDISLLEKFFPTPVIQMDIEANIPWVLKEKNSYLL